MKRAAVTLLVLLAGAIVVLVWRDAPAPIPRPDERSPALSDTERPLVGVVDVVDDAKETRRDAVVRDLLIGSVRELEDSAISDALVTWSPFGEFSSRSLGWMDPVDARRRERSTDSEGAFVFEMRELATDGTSSVLWGTKPGHSPGFLVLDGDATTWPSVVKMVLPRAAPVRVVCLGAGRTPLPGARVEQVGISPADPRDASLSDEFAFRSYRRTWDTDSTGSASIPALEGFQLLVARHGPLASRPRIERSPSGRTIELILEACFAAEGSVVFDPSMSRRDDFVVAVHASDGPAELLLAEARVDAAGRWGPLGVPLPEYPDLVFKLRGPGSVPDKRTVARPVADERVFVELHATPAEAVGVYVVDAADSKAIEGASVRVSSLAAGGDWMQVERKSDENGFVEFDECGRGSVSITAWGAGYLRTSTGLIDIDPAAGQAYEIELERGGTVRGTVKHRGEPVRDFEIVFWQSHPHPVNAHAFHDRDDGTFEIDGVPAGRTSFIASARSLPPCDPVPVEVELSKPARVELDLPAARRGGGIVVDAADSSPVPSATVQIWTSFGNHLLTRRSRRHPVDELGRFSLDHLGPGSAWFMVEAPGYSTLSGEAKLEIDGEIDFGTIALSRRGIVEFQLVSPRQIDFRRFSLRLRTQEVLPLVTFDSEGRAVVEGVPPGRWTAEISREDGLRFFTSVSLPPGREWKVTVPIRSGELELVLVPSSPGGVVPADVHAIAWTTGADGRTVTSTFPFDGEGRASIDLVAGERATIEAIGPEQRSLALVHVVLDGGTKSVRIPIADADLCLRVVDRDGAPIPDCVVSLCSDDASTRWAPERRTDDEGRVCFVVPIDGDLAAVLRHPAHGTALGVPVPRPDLGRGEVTLTFSPDAELLLRMADGEVPFVGGRVELRDPNGGRRFHRDLSADSDGILRFGPVNETAFEIELMHPGYWPSEHLVSARPNPAMQQIQVRRTGSLSLRVTRSNGAPAKSARISLSSVEFDTEVATWIEQGRLPSASTLVTSAQGEARVDGLPRGEYRWSLETEQGTVAVPPHAIGKLDIVLP